jgi:hypothetical protein
MLFIDDIHLFAFPFNLIVGVILFCIGSYFRKWLTSAPAALSAIAIFIGTSISLGLSSREGIKAILESYPYAVAMMWVVVVLSGAISKRLVFVFKGREIKRRELAFLATHIGLLLALFGGYFGSCDKYISKMVVDDTTNHLVPFDVKLRDFSVEYYPSGEPSFYEAVLSLEGEDGERVSVNHPLHHRGWDIYLSSYRMGGDGNVQYCVLKLVKQPWKGVIMVGIVLMLIGALALLPKRRENGVG